MSELMRGDFEAEFRKHPRFEGNAIYTDAMLERGSDGAYRFTIAEGAWWGWKASRESLVIELPVIVDKEWANTHAERSAMREAIGWCKKRIEAAGLKAKP